MPKLPRPSGKQMIRFLHSQGFSTIRVRGSHHVLACNTSRSVYLRFSHQRSTKVIRTTVPVHGHRPLKIGTLGSILRDIGMSPKHFMALWDQ